MADFLPPVIAILKGDIKDFSQKMGEARKQMGSTASSGEKSAEQTRKSWMTGTAAIGGAAIGLTGLLIKMGEKQERAGDVLRRVIENQGRSYADYADDVRAAEKANQNYGHSIAETRTALGKLTLATKDPRRALDQMQLAADIASTKNISLSEAADEVRKILQGNSKVLKTYGISMLDAKKAQADLESAQKEHTKAIERVKDAQQNLSDIQEVLSEKDELSISDKHRLRDANKELADAQSSLASSTQNVTTQQEAATKATADGDRALKEVSKTVKGIADEDAKGLSGTIDKWKTKVTDVGATIGEKLNGVLGGTASIATILSGVIALQSVGALAKLGAAAGAAAGVLGFGAAVVGGVGLGFVINKLIETQFPTLHEAISVSEGVFASFIRFAADATSGTMSWKESLDKLAERLNKTWMGDVTDFLNNMYAKSGILQTLSGNKNKGGSSGNTFQTGVAIPRMAEGGIVTRPTLAVVGEAGPEAVVPLGQMSQGSVVININGVQGDATQIASEVHKIFLRYQRRNPSLGFA